MVWLHGKATMQNKLSYCTFNYKPKQNKLINISVIIIIIIIIII